MFWLSSQNGGIDLQSESASLFPLSEEYARLIIERSHHSASASPSFLPFVTSLKKNHSLDIVSDGVVKLKLVSLNNDLSPPTTDGFNVSQHCSRVNGPITATKS